MNIYTMMFVFSCLVVTTLPASEVNVTEDYIWQERYKDRLELARSGDAEAQFNIGEMFEKGSGIHADLAKAFTWYEQAANQNHQKAQFKIAYMYYRGEGVVANPAKAFQLMTPLAKYGYVRAQYYLALMYETGAGTPRNLEQAQLWYSRAAVGSYAPAAQALADTKRFPAQQRAPVESARTEQINTSSTPAANSKSPAPVDTRVTENIPSNLSSPLSKNDPIATALRNEAARGAQIALGLNASNTVHIPTPAPTTAVAGLQPIIQMQPTTYSVLANGNWVSQTNVPVEFLPSKFTTCEPSNETAIECTSKELSRAIGDSEIGYLTQATVYAVQPSGEFKVTYRNNIVKINRRREGRTSIDSTIKLGLQDTEHHLECKLENEWIIQCVKNLTQKITLTKQTTESNK